MNDCSATLNGKKVIIETEWCVVHDQPSNMCQMSKLLEAYKWAFTYMVDGVGIIAAPEKQHRMIELYEMATGVKWQTEKEKK